MKTLFENECCAAAWGLSDFYKDCEEEIKTVWESGEDFTTDYGCKKEIHYANIERRNGTTTVTARAYIDELMELIDTAIWRAYGGNDKSSGGYDAVSKIFNLDPNTDEDKIHDRMQEIADSVCEMYEEGHEASSELPPGATWDQFVETLDRCETEAATKAEECYQAIVEAIKWYLEECLYIDLGSK